MKAKKTFLFKCNSTMSTKAKTTEKRVDTYQEITDFVIGYLEKGHAIWRKPWKAKPGAKTNAAKNLTTAKDYQGWNHFYLEFVRTAHNFSSPYFVTFLQAKTLGGHIKKDSKGFHIVKWVAVEKEKRPSRNSPVENDATTETKLFPTVHTVFNVAQTEGLEYPTDEPIVLTEPERLDQCERIVHGMPGRPDIREGGNQACYYPQIDRIQMPPYGDFTPREAYYNTLFHELVHSTGHTKRLNRKELMESDGFQGKKYSREELTAEMGAAFLSGIAGIEQKTIDNSAAYLKGWVRAFTDDKMMILQAAAKAQAAADFILGVEETEAHPTAETIHAVA